MLIKEELIEEINDLLDTWSPSRAKRILSKLTALDLLALKQAIEDCVKKRREP